MKGILKNIFVLLLTILIIGAEIGLFVYFGFTLDWPVLCNAIIDLPITLFALSIIWDCLIWD